MSGGVVNANLPQVVLRGKTVPADVLAMIPLPTVEKYQVAAFEVDDTTLKLAIVYPEQLKQGFYTALSDIGAKIGKKVELYKTDAGSIQHILGQYRASLKASEGGSPAPVPAKPGGSAPAGASSDPKPPLFQVGKTVAYNYLKRTPLDFAKAQRVVCVDFLAPNTYWFATDNPSGKEQLVDQIAAQNKITAHIVSLNKRDLDDLLSYYASLVKEEEKKEQDRKKQIETDHVKAMEKAIAQSKVANNPVTSPLPEVKVVPGMVVPEVQATILTTEEEKGGIAGLIQRFGHSVSVKHEESSASAAKTDSDKAPAPSTAPAPAAVPGTPAVSAPSSSPAAPGTPAAPAQAAASGGVTVQANLPNVTASSTPAASATAAPGTKPAESAKPGSKDDESSDIGRLLTKEMTSIDDLKEIMKQGSIPSIVAAIVDFAIHEKASDIHIEVFVDEVRVRYRMDGQLIDVIKLPPDLHAAVVSRIKILSRLRLDETRVPQDGRFDVNFEHAQVDLRVSVMPTVHGEKVVMRILDKNRGITSLDSLGVMGLAYQNLLKAIEKPFGICLATGPTGSGKSTSLYAILKQIATPNVNVVTLEDPVEYEMKGINQSQIRPKIGFTFAEGLRSILRQDPNIIMVGEIRDGETANMATQAALTGHLVLSTLHTNDAAGAIPRLQNMGIETFLITSSLNVAVGQRLVRKICQNCKAAVNLPGGLRDQFAKDIEIVRNINPIDAKRIPENVQFFQGMGCDQCNGRGYQGRLGIYEVLMMSEAIEALALKRASGGQIQEQAQKEGMLTMYQDGLLKVVNGLTTLDEVLKETSNK